MSMEAEASHDLLSAGWRARKAGGVTPGPSPRPETQEHPCLRAGEDGYLSSGKKKKQICPFFAFAFVIFSAAQRLHDAHLL